MCRDHWFALPKPIRDEIWRTYRKGQEDDKRPSEAYVRAAQEAKRYLSERRRPDASSD
jgi:hypothetical protein